MPLRLTETQVAQYRDEGYTAPVAVLSAEEARRHRAALEAYEAIGGKPLTFPEKSKCYLLFSWADAIVHHPAVLDAVQDVIGPNILLFHFTLQTKEAHSQTFVTWHQDDAYFHLDPGEQVTAWVALSDSTAESGAIRMLPGSHKHGLIDHFDNPSEHNLIRRGQTVDGLRPEDGVLAPLKAGEMSLHHTHTLHASGANDSDDRRIGLTISYVPTHVRPTTGDKPAALLVRGVDHYEHFEKETRLVTELSPEARAAHRRSTGLYVKLSRMPV
jgi:ectoine hydroxylase-related dioxygenase (phytanoyl-CoA dioxygenase family)